MSKIGRKLIAVSSAKIEINDGNLKVKGPKGEFTHQLPADLSATMESKGLKLTLTGENTRENKMLWGLHRALLASKIVGVENGFQSVVKIVGLGFKAQVSGKKVALTLGKSHKDEYDLPEGVSAATDKSGQILTVTSVNKALLGQVCDDIRSFKKPEPYKGTGIMRDEEVIIRKAGKTKSSS